MLNSELRKTLWISVLFGFKNCREGIVAHSCPLDMGTYRECDCKEKGLEGDKPNRDVWGWVGIERNSQRESKSHLYHFNFLQNEEPTHLFLE